MVIWILIFPSSMLIGRVGEMDVTTGLTLHERIYQKLFAHDGPVPMDYHVKFQGHTAIHLTHHIPAAIWAACIPIQLHPQIRKTYKQLHRMTGYIFLLCSILISLGVYLIIQRQLGYIHYFTDLPPMEGLQHPPEDLLFTALVVWFGMTALQAYRSAATHKQYTRHSHWIYRHVASGLWVSVQRNLIALHSICIQTSYTRYEQRQLFGNAAQVAIILCAITAEVVIYYEKNKNKTNNAITENPKDKKKI